MKIPSVDGDLWWKHVARREKWPEAVGDPVLLKEAKRKFLELFTDKSDKPRKSKDSASSARANPSPGSRVSLYYDYRLYLSILPISCGGGFNKRGPEDEPVCKPFF